MMPGCGLASLFFGAFGEMAAQTVALASTVCSVVRIFCSIG